jgi:predicted transcriptional regulator
MSDAGAKNFIELTASIVSAYLGNNPTPAAEIPNLISQVHGALVRVSSAASRRRRSSRPSRRCR